MDSVAHFEEPCSAHAPPDAHGHHYMFRASALAFDQNVPHLPTERERDKRDGRWPQRRK